MFRRAASLTLFVMAVFVSAEFFGITPVVLVPPAASAQRPHVSKASASTTLSNAILIDHRNTDLSRIPPYWIEQAKQLTIHFAHRSHGGQILLGLAALDNASNHLYKYADIGSDTTVQLPPQTNPPSLRAYSGNPPVEYVTPEYYWSTTSGLNGTRRVVGTRLFTTSTWFWSGELNSASTAYVQQYLDAITLLEGEFPNVAFVYQTNNSVADNDPNAATLARNHRMIRDYVTANRKILYDFEDIEKYDPAGAYHPEADESCPWCPNWCSTHPADCQGLANVCPHTDPFMCKLKAEAWWWLMTRLAGWDGVTQGVPSPTPLLSTATPSSPRPSPTMTSTRTPVPTSTPSRTPTSTPVGIQTATATRVGIITPTSTNTATPTLPVVTSTMAVATPTASASASASASATQVGVDTVTFDDLAGQEQQLAGEYPSGVIDWGPAGVWWHSQPWAQFNTKSLSYDGPSVRGGSFRLVGRRLVGLTIDNGDTISTVVTLSCAGNPDVQISLAPATVRTVSTGWSNTCSAVTLTSTNGWGTNFDNLLLAAP